MSKVFFTDFLSIKAYVLSKITYIKGSSRPVVSALGLAHWIVGVFKGFSFCTTMSASARFIRAALTAAAEEEIRVVNYANYAKTTVLAYEILINLGREVDLVWSAKFRWSSLIYFMNRYPVVAFQIWELCYSTKIPHCDAWYSFFWYASFLPTRAAITASFALRVYAIMDGNLMFPVVLSLLGIAVIGCDIWQGVQSSCTQFSDKTSTITTFMFLACFDILSTLLVTVRMFRNIIWSGGFKGLGSQNVAAYILKSGVLYFGVVTIPQLVAIALYFDPKEGSATILNNVMLVLSSIMVTRFLLGLREMNNKKIITDSEFTPSFSVSGPVAFAPNPNPGIKNKHFHRRVPRSPRQRRFGDSSLLKDFADYEDVEGLSEESTEFTRTQFSAKEVYSSVGSHQLDSISRPIEELIVRGRRVEEGLNHEVESIITNSPS